MAPSKNVTSPVGVPAPGAFTVTVAVNVTVSPSVTEPGELTTTVVVSALCTVSVAVPLLAVCTLVAEKFAVIVCAPDIVGVSVTVQVAAFVPLAASVQGVPLNDSVPEFVSAIVPVGFNAVPLASSSVTVTVTVEGSPTTTGLGESPTVVVVCRVFTISVFEPLLVVCTPVPGNVAPIVCAPAAAGVSITVQLEAFTALAASTQAPLNGSPPEFVSMIVPLGLDGLPAGSTSVTVTIT